MEDYIQKDLELIRKATTEDKAISGEAAKKIKVEKTEKKMKNKKNSDVLGSNSTKSVVKKTSKPLSPKREDSKTEQAKDKAKSRKSIGGSKLSPSLGRIKFGPSVKKSTKGSKNDQSTPSRGKKTKKDAETQKLPSSEVSAKDKVVKKTASPGVTSKSYKGIDPNAVPLEAIRFEEGIKIEAVDNGIWYKAKIIKVDEENMDILVHFDGWGARFDTWFPMTSSLIRGRTELDIKQDTVKYSAEEDVLAKWSDGNFYPATVLTVKESGSCLVMYFDGMKKLLRPNAIKKMSEKEKEESMKAVQQLLLLPPSEVSSPNSPQSVGSPTSSDGANFRRYKTSANDREKRISARLGGSDRTPAKKLPPKRGQKRKASTPIADEVNSLSISVPTSKSLSPSEESLRAKKARLDKITHNLLDRVSPTSECDIKKMQSKESDIEKPEVKDKFEELTEKTDESITSTDALKRAQPKGKPQKDSVNVKKDSSRKNVEQAEDSQTIPSSDVTQQKAKAEKDLDQEMHDLEKNNEPRKEASEALLQLAQAYNHITDISSDGSGTTSSAKVMDIQLEAKSGKDPESTFDTTLKPPKEEEVNNDKSISESKKASVTIDDQKLPTTYKTGDIVLAKWADCRSYLAYVLKKEPDDQYKIQYYDGMIKTVKSSFIHPWVGPLPSTLKVFKDRSHQSSKQRRKHSTDARKSKTEKNAKKAPMKQHSKKGVPAISKKEPEKTARRRSRSTSEEVPIGAIKFLPNEKVLAKWTDLKCYPATIVRQTDRDLYQVKYHDGHVKTVRDTWITPWNPPHQQAEVIASKEPGENTNTTEASKEISEENNLKSDIAAQEEGSTATEVNIVGHGEQSLKTYEKFQVGDNVLARWTDCRSYPATVKNIEDDGKYVVEYYDGMQKALKPDLIKHWNPSALPPSTRIKPQETEADSKTSTEIDGQPGKLKRGRPSKQEKKTGSMFQPAPKQQTLPRQVVRGYDAYYARLPPETKDLILDNKYKCRVPGCVKTFRKESLLRQHHKFYHQQRYKLRDSETPPPKRKSSKEDLSPVSVTRRRVSADYEAIQKGLDVGNDGNLKTRGAKPPIDVYKQQHASAIVSSGSSLQNSGSGSEQTTLKEDFPLINDDKGKSLVDIESTDTTLKSNKRKRSRKESDQRGEKILSYPKQMEDPIVVVEPLNSLELSGQEKPVTVNEDVIRCICGMEEEDGFMIQCEGCYTWQHTACLGVEQKFNKYKVKDTKYKEITGGRGTEHQEGKTTVENLAAQKDADNQITEENYVCYVCKDPPNIRKSKKYMYNNDFLTKGKLPSLSKLESTTEMNEKNGNEKKKSLDVMFLAIHQLMEEVVKMQDTLQGIKHKIKVVATPDKQKIVKTHKEIEDTLDETPTTPPQEEKKIDDTLSTLESDLINKDTEKATEQKISYSAESVCSPPVTSLVHNSTESVHSLHCESSICPTETEIVIEKQERNADSSSVGDKLNKKPNSNTSEKDRTLPELATVDQEVYIHKCRDKLLDHILELETTLANRLTRLEEYVSNIDTEDEAEEENEDIGKLREDLTAVQKLLLCC